MKIKTNALEFYMNSKEVIKSITSNDLNLKDIVRNKIEFLEENQGKEIFIKGYDEENVKISKYEKTEIFEFPINILEIEEEEEEKEIDFNSKIYFSKKYIIIYILIIIIMMIGFLVHNRNIKEIEIKNISDIELTYNKIKDLDTNIAIELEIQKKARIIEKESINKVIQMEKEQKELKLNALNLSNDL